jgi:hypothetical protein
VAVFCQFVSALKSKAVAITQENIHGLSLLCDEFGFADLEVKLSEFQRSPDFKKTLTIQGAEVRLRLSALEERGRECDRALALLQSELLRQSRAQEGCDGALAAAVGRLSRLEGEVAQMRSSAEGSTPNVAQAVVASAPTAAPPALARLAQATPAATAPEAAPPAPALASVIVADFPDIFAEFRGKRFSLLWRGGRDGFGAREFHSRCDGHANTLTIIQDTDGNVFGGFTPVEWESRGTWKADESLKSFLFTLTNPHKVPARRFTLKAEMKDKAIYCNSYWGPHFWDIGVPDHCNANTDCCTFRFGYSYTNDTGLNGETFFAGPKDLQVKEIEVFEVAD